MFKKNSALSDFKKSQQKCLDTKKDTPTRLKHLKVVTENPDIYDTRYFFETNYSAVFYIFYDVFISTEANLHQKGTFAVQRGHKEDLECALSILDRILCLVPELIEKRWQCNALTHVFKKLLHPGNTVYQRKEGMRLFVLWYMIVGEAKTYDMDFMFASLIPGFPVPQSSVNLAEQAYAKVTSVDPQPICPASSTDKVPDDITSYFLRSLLDFMVSQVWRVDWKDKSLYHKSFSYVFEMFKKVYLPYIFPDFSSVNSLYKPNLDLPSLRTSPGVSPFGTCQVTLVDWVRKYVMAIPKRTDVLNVPPTGDDSGRQSVQTIETTETEHESYMSSFYANEWNNAADDVNLVRDVLFSTRENVNFIHELFRQALCLSFRYSGAMKTVIMCYRNWIQMAAGVNGQVMSELPPFMMEPPEVGGSPRDEFLLDSARRMRDIYPKDAYVRAGLQNVLQVFVTSAANVFLLEVSADYPRLLDEQVELCKHVLNIYRYMVMNTRMEQKTWEQLLIVLFHITSQILSGHQHRSKEDTLGGRFASALFQTLIVSWIKANLSVVISVDLWDQLLSTLSSLTHWEELIKEWAKTLDTLTRVLARHVYGLELNNLPLDRVTERKAIKRGTKVSGLESVRSSFARGWMGMKGEHRGTLGHNGGPMSGDYPSSGPQSSISQHHEDSHHDGFHHRSPFSRKRLNSAGSSNRGAGGSMGGSTTEGTISGSPHPHLGQMDHRSYHHQCHHHHSHQGRRFLFRSLSESHLVVHRLYRRHQYRQQEFELCQMGDRQHNFRSLSLDALRHDYYSDSRSPSPSSCIESSSMKDSPMQLDFGGDTASIDTMDGGLSSEQRSVMAGGSVRGWLPDVAVVLWRRVLGLLGDPNDVSSPHIHASIFRYLVDLTDTLIKLRNNQGISLDNQSSPEPPELIPPMYIVVPWCFKALTLPAVYHRGKTLAYRLLCLSVVRRHDLPPSKELLTQFYRILHQGLVGTDQEIINTLVAGCAPYFFSLRLPGSSMLALDFIHATHTVISSSDPKHQNPRTEALTLLGSLYPLASLYQCMPVLQPSAAELTLMSCSDVKDHLINVLLKCSRRDSWWKSRSLALCAVTYYVYHELGLRTFHSKVREAVNILLVSLQPVSSSSVSKQLPLYYEIGRLVGQVAADMLLLLCDHSDVIVKDYDDLASKIVQVLCQTLMSIGNDAQLMSGSDGQYLVLSILFCLAEWVLQLPQQVLLMPTNEQMPLLNLVFKVLHMMASSGNLGTNMKAASVDVSDFDMNVSEEGVSSATSDSVLKGNSLRRNFTSSVYSTVRLAARSVTNHLLNHLWHFPLGIGAQRLSSLVSENDDVPGLSGDDLGTEVFNSPHIQLFTLNHSCLLSLVQLPALQVPGGAATAGFKTPNTEVRIILRDIAGKFSWDASVLYKPPPEDVSDVLQDDFSTSEELFESSPVPLSSSSVGQGASLNQGTVSPFFSKPGTMQGSTVVSQQCLPPPLFTKSSGVESQMEDSCTSLRQYPSPRYNLRYALRHRLPGVLPSYEDSAEDLDNLDDLLSYVGYTSPEVMEQFGHILNESVGPPPNLPVEIQHDAISTILSQHNTETECLSRNAANPVMSCPPISSPAPVEETAAFQQCRLLFDQLGLASWEKRPTIHVLRKNDRLLRELKNLDNQKCRETHKVAVIYVAVGQEDKLSILGNSGGSALFEEFVGALGWEVELSSHTGFMGGLQRNGTTGDTAPYYASSLTEVIFHVSTRMPSNSEQGLLQKTRHLGNDEVHIVWSEHTRDYRRGIIATEFGDVLIVIYPMPNRLYRIQISTKPDVPFFGPLFDGALVSHRVLPGLVRATAVNASRAKRSRLSLYQNFYEERAHALDTIIDQYSEATTFENFMSSVYSPVFTNMFVGGCARASGTSFSRYDPSASVSVSIGMGDSTSGLAAALLDGPPSSCSISQCTPSTQRGQNSRPTSYSIGEQHKLKEKAKSVFHTGSLSVTEINLSSPKSAKKQSFKSIGSHKVPSASSLEPGGSRNIPESPVPPPRKTKDGSGRSK